MTQDDLIVTGAVQEVQENSGNLALTWQLRPATVSSVANGIASVVMDGDVNAIVALSLAGSVGAGDRVHIIQIPPSGNYIVGFGYGTSLVQMASFKGLANSPQQVSAATFTNVLQTGGSAVTETFYKQRSASRVAYNFVGDAFASAFGDTVEYGMLIDGTDYAMTSYFFNAASDHRTVAGSSVFETLDIPAGEYEVTLRWRNPTGTAANMDQNSQLTFQLYEVAPLPS